MWDEYVLDCSNIDVGWIPCFCPYENGKIIVGVNILQDKCPGKLVGVIHSGGQQATEEWITQNPNWYKIYRRHNEDSARQ